MKPTLEQIKEAVEEFEMDYAYVGIRTQEEEFELGPMSHVSHIWDDGFDTGEELDGLSVTNATSSSVECHCNGYYFGDHVAIVCGDIAQYGEDIGELVIEDPVCVKIFC